MSRFNAWLQISVLYVVVYTVVSSWLETDFSVVGVVSFSTGAALALYHHWRWQ